MLQMIKVWSLNVYDVLTWAGFNWEVCLKVWKTEGRINAFAKVFCLIGAQIQITKNWQSKNILFFILFPFYKDGLFSFQFACCYRGKKEVLTIYIWDQWNQVRFSLNQMKVVLIWQMKPFGMCELKFTKLVTSSYLTFS